MPFVTLLTEVSLAYGMSGAQVDKSYVGIFTAAWPEDLLLPQQFFFTKIELSATELEGMYSAY